ncbi:MAG: sugar ABC transporter permease [Rhodobacteraceae bacterium]|uniref:Transport permease protein n=1 Tax=Salipiger profundus TaxID=1229727 RepID=A0A1U7DE16_9RHOB|nr:MULTISPECIES: ABC transporter permease [Salipiger]APX26368.1 capsular polysaccharide transport system permease protein [Salipiger profundus]MAB05011.1 sugar ABC transporter permease [Paracoccaceae bacterium]GGA21994.1 transport permease protein [Salipiger profundus]
MAHAPQSPRELRAVRTIAALVLREMGTTHGRAIGGYLWAILEPVGGILLLTLAFSMAFRSPSLGTNFPLFYASGLLPFLMYIDLSQKISVTIRFSKALLFYPAVTFIDALLARLLINGLTQILIFCLVLGGILVLYDVRVMLDIPALVLALSMAIALSVGIGTMNCFLLSLYPTWERAWAILNRPLLLISCIFFIFDDIPEPFKSVLWYNPLVHIIGQTRKGIYSFYNGDYVSPAYVFGIALVTFAFGLVMLRKHYKTIINT